jgi:hypothetical protein
MSFLSRDRKVKKFAKEVTEKQNTIFVFGSGSLAQEFISDLIHLGLASKVALIADSEKAWIDDLSDEITCLIEQKIDKYKDKKLYDLIGFSLAEKIIILHENTELVQYIINNIEDISKSDIKIIMVSQYAPPFVKYLSQAQRDKFIITDNVHSITAELYNLLGLSLDQPPIITVPVSKKYIGKSGSDLDIELKKSKLLRIERQIEETTVLLPPVNILKENDSVMLYLFEGEDSIKELIETSPKLT